MTFSLLRYLDSPMRFLSFTMGDLISYLSPIFLGALFDSLLIIPGLGLVAVMGVKKVTKKFPEFFLIRWFYWSLPTGVFNRILRIEWPPSHKRLWIK